MSSRAPHDSTSRAPLAMLYHENSKITPSTAVLVAERIAQFATDTDVLRRVATSYKTYPGAERIDLSPWRSLPFPSTPLDAVFRNRRSVREFRADPLGLPKIAQLLEVAAGVTSRLHDPDHAERQQFIRAYPSGGALYPVEVYVAAMRVNGLVAGLYHFHPAQHVLEQVRIGDLHDALEKSLWIGGQALTAPAILLLSGRWEFPLQKYGERGYRILWLEAGHLMENLLLAAVALQLGACPVAGFQDDQLAEHLQLDSQREPVLYGMLLGHPADPIGQGSRVASRGEDQ